MTGRSIELLFESKYYLILEAHMTAKSNDVSSNAVGAEITKALRNFRSSADIENFYRFVFENDLRREAKMILESICKQINQKKKKSRKRQKRKN